MSSIDGFMMKRRLTMNERMKMKARFQKDFILLSVFLETLFIISTQIVSRSTETANDCVSGDDLN